ncbi:prolyl oligopeptidase family serine peptidase [Ferrimonas lipolytica]|uniref:prolyl oligopeptidase n=1 Tax=Ferrimonas lipolytica TaxID=2724191 RepID=A0A6H1UDQ4_9GAMM|nr:prolyl oligopeptidase family serine peptidase [Ferrimonas lipolytica]QIZ76346.1 S9 family peptidase [Ferrimonas lipolytica]
MNIIKASIAAVTVSLLCACQQSANVTQYELHPPVSQQEPLVEQLHGVAVTDPYRYLEQLDSAKTNQWVNAQRQYGDNYLAQIPNRDVVEQRISELWDYASSQAPFFHNGREFFFANNGLQSQNVLYMKASEGAQAQVVIDPNTFSSDGTIALTDVSVSPDGKTLAYGTSVSGSDWQTWQFIDIDSGQSRGDKLKWLKFTGATWAKDGSGVWYARYDEPKDGNKMEQVNYDQKLYFHTLGQSQQQDRLVYQRPDQKEWGFSVDLTESGNQLIIYASQGTDPRRRVFIQDLTTLKVSPLLPELEAAYDYLGERDDRLLFFTDYQAPKGRIVAIDPNAPAKANWDEVIAETQQPISDMALVNERLVLVSLKDVLADMNVYRLDGTLETHLQLPAAGRVRHLKGKRNSSSLFFEFNSYIHPTGVYRYDFDGKGIQTYNLPEVAFNPGDYQTEQVFYSSKDGTRVPMLISYKKGLKKDGSNPTLLYAYGGFNINITPRFSPANIAWMDLGGVYAVPNIRGGSEYGEEWHQAGMLEHKQNVFDDYYAAAEYLIDQGYTTSTSLGAYGRSNGGLLMGAALTQRPDLFAAVLPAVGVLDMLRFHKFTIGWAWVSEYGSADSAKQFEYLYKYSPYHNLKVQDYPATMVMTADHDDRVVPSHSFKFTAMMQQLQRGDAPVIARIEHNAGHGAGKPTAMKIAEYRDIFAFLMTNFEKDLPSKI